MKKITFWRNLIVLAALLIGSGSAMGQTTLITNDCSTATAGWTFTNNVTTNQIQQGGYWLLDASSSAKDEIITPALDVTNYTNLTLTFRLATYGSGTNNPAQVDYSLDGGSTWSTTKFTSATPTSSTYINSGSINLGTLNTTTLKIRFVNAGNTTKGVRMDDILLVGTFAPSCTASELAFGSPTTVEKLADDVNFIKTATSLNETTAIVYSSSDTGVATVNSSTGEVDILSAGTTTITATQAAGTHNSVDYCAGEVTYTLNVAPVDPTITVTEETVPAMSAYVDASDSETITVNGVNLTTDITLSLGGADAAQFRLSTSTLAQTDGSVTDASVTIYYEPKASGSHIATLTLSSNGATDVTRTLNGEVIEPITAPNVIITEVYGGGGNSGATYTHDFFELYNTTENSVPIGGWSLQYYAATGTGTSSNVIVIPDGKYIPAKSHFLIQSASGGAVGVALPAPDATGTVNAAAAAGKVILYTTNAPQTINSSDITSITGNEFFKDYLPFGSTSVPLWGSAMVTMSGNTSSATRKKVEGEYVYTQNIGNDFEVASPNPQNTGIVSSTDNPSSLTSIYAHNAKIHFAATAGEKVEVYNAVGQKIISTLATDGQNELSVNAKGVMIVKVGSRLAKVIL